MLTSSRLGTASRVLPELCKNSNIEVTRVVLAHGVSLDRKKYFKRKIQKTIKIGVLGALNGLRLRDWYEDNDTEDIVAFCNTFGVSFYETPCVNCDMTRMLFTEAAADLGLSLGNGYIAQSVFSIPRYGMINLHTEILPDFQGAQSVIWPIYERRKETGYTIHQIDNGIDTGEIIYQEKYPIQFFPTLKETVRKNLDKTRVKFPTAISFVCDNYVALKAAATSQSKGKYYTTPSFSQYLKMVKNNYSMYRENIIF